MEQVYKNISKDIQDLYNIFNQLDLIASYRTLHLKTEQNTYFFQSTHGTFTNIDHILSIKQVSINLKMIKSYKVNSPATVELN